jgi:hypothetical protein
MGACSHSGHPKNLNPVPIGLARIWLPESGNYHQLTRDRGGGDRVGAFESRVAAVGPEVGYVFKVNGQPPYFNLRGYWEYSAGNRVEGYALFATLSIPLGSAGK